MNMIGNPPNKHMKGSNFFLRSIVGLDRSDGPGKSDPPASTHPKGHLWPLRPETPLFDLDSSNIIITLKAIGLNTPISK